MLNNADMDWIGHLGELRKRIIWVLLIFVITMIAGLFIANPVLDYLKSAKPATDMTWHAFSPWDAIGIYMKFAFGVSLVISLPFTLFQLWLFVRPGLRDVERTATIKYIPIAFILFLVGASFGYFVVFPMAFAFTTKVTIGLGLEETYGIIQYFSFMFNIVIPLSILFELPVVVMFLTRIRILNPKRLQKMRRLAYLIMVIIGTVVTPPDLISDLLVAIPLILLYEVSVLFSVLIYRKLPKGESAGWLADLPD